MAGEPEAFEAKKSACWPAVVEASVNVGPLLRVTSRYFPLLRVTSRYFASVASRPRRPVEPMIGGQVTR